MNNRSVTHKAKKDNHRRFIANFAPVKQQQKIKWVFCKQTTTAAAATAEATQIQTTRLHENRQTTLKRRRENKPEQTYAREMNKQSQWLSDYRHRCKLIKCSIKKARSVELPCRLLLLFLNLDKDQPNINSLSVNKKTFSRGLMASLELIFQSLLSPPPSQNKHILLNGRKLGWFYHWLDAAVFNLTSSFASLLNCVYKCI